MAKALNESREMNEREAYEKMQRLKTEWGSAGRPHPRRRRVVLHIAAFQ